MFPSSVVSIPVQAAIPLEDWEPTVYGITRAGRPIPARFVGVEPNGYFRLSTKAGKEYTFAPDHILTVAEALAHMERDKVALVLSTYTFDLVTTTPCRVIHCYHPTRKRSSYLLIEGAGGFLCSCEAFAASPDRTCKHTLAQAARDMAVREPVEEKPVEVKAPAKKAIRKYDAGEW